MKTTLLPVRLERTREVLLELLRSIRNALPIVAGVAGPIFVASFALLAWAGVPPMIAVTLPWRSAVPLWIAQAVLAAWPLWALRARLLPEAWCVQLRCLPIPARALWASDVAVSAVVLAPLAGLYVVSVAVFAINRPAWWIKAMPWAPLSLVASWGVSCALGAAALAWQRRGGLARRHRVTRARSAQDMLAQRARPTTALLWWPGWRGALAPGFASMIVGVLAASGLALAWTLGPWPVVPGAAWALLFGLLLVTLTERLQRTMEAHLDALGPWLAALPTDAGWRWRARARAVVAAPMAVAGAIAIALVMAARPWRGLPLTAFALLLLAAPWLLTSVRSSQREAHVALWAVTTGLLTALGSELWN